MPKYEKYHAFQNTRWSMVYRADGSRDQPHVRAALDDLLFDYWRPIYCAIRRKRPKLNEHQAADFVHDFITRIRDRESFGKFRKGETRFRTYLLRCLDNFLVDMDREGKSRRRGGKATLLSIDAEEADHWYHEEIISSEMTPDQALQRTMAREVLRKAENVLTEDANRDGHAELLASLRDKLFAPEESRNYAEIVPTLGITISQAKDHVRRFRKRLREIIREIVSETLDNPNDVDDEIAALQNAL